MLKGNRLRAWLASFGMGVLIVHAVHSPAARAQVPAEAGPKAVTVGIYVTRIHEINLKQHYFVAEFYVWFRWKDPELRPYQTFSLVRAREILSKSEPVVKKELLPGAQHYAFVRMVAQVSNFWDLAEYPLDRHPLVLSVEEEEREDHLIRYLADNQNSGFNRDISIPGWRVAGFWVKDDVRVYRSNFGDTSLQSGHSRYARMSLTMNLTREGTLYFMKLLFGLWVAAAISFLAFFIHVRDADPRFGVGVAAIFAAIASEFLITESLPETNVITLADKLHLLTYAFIFGTLAQSTWSLRLAEKGRELESKKWDRLAAWTFPLAYAVATVLMIYRCASNMRG